MPQQAIYIPVKINEDVPGIKKFEQDLECKCHEVSMLIVC